MRRHLVKLRTAVLLALALALAACGGSASTKGSGGSASASAGTADSAAILKVGAEMTSNQGPMFDMDAGHNQGVSAQWLDLMYDTMIRKTTKGLEPELATAWKVVDPQTLDITLRTGVKFQDGTPFDADAVAYAWNRPKPAYQRPEVVAITTVTVVSPNQVRVAFKTPVAGSFISAVMVDAFFPVPSPTALKAAGADYSKHPVGAGPYAFDSYAADQKISVRKWNGYWNPKLQLMGGVDFLNIATGAPRITALASGQIDIGQVTTKELDAVKRQSNLVTDVQQSPATYTLSLCLNKAPFNNLALRQALAQAVDRKSLNQGMFNGVGTPTDQWFTPSSPYYVKSLADKNVFDVAKAKSAWQAAGGPSSFSIFTSTVDADAITAQSILQAQFKDIGVDVKLLSSPDIFQVGRVGADAMIVPPRPETYTPYFGVGGTLNWCGFNSDAIVNAYKLINGGTGTDAEVKAAWATISQTFADQLPAIWLVNTSVIEAHSKKVTGVGFIRPIVGMAADLRGVSIAK